LRKLKDQKKQKKLTQKKIKNNGRSSKIHIEFIK
jgi:hypothetical protein